MEKSLEDKNIIYKQYREVLGMPDLTDKEIVKIHNHFMQMGMILYEWYRDAVFTEKARTGRKK